MDANGRRFPKSHTHTYIRSRRDIETAFEWDLYTRCMCMSTRLVGCNTRTHRHTDTWLAGSSETNRVVHSICELSLHSKRMAWLCDCANRRSLHAYWCASLFTFGNVIHAHKPSSAAVPQWEFKYTDTRAQHTHLNRYSSKTVRMAWIFRVFRKSSIGTVTYDKTNTCTSCTPCMASSQWKCSGSRTHTHAVASVQMANGCAHTVNQSHTQAFARIHKHTHAHTATPDREIKPYQTID